MKTVDGILTKPRPLISSILIHKDLFYVQLRNQQEIENFRMLESSINDNVHEKEH